MDFNFFQAGNPTSIYAFSGAYASLPAANSVNVGTECIVTDKGFGDVVMRTDGTNWWPQGSVSDKAPFVWELFTDFNGISGGDWQMVASGTGATSQAVMSTTPSTPTGQGNWQGSTGAGANNSCYVSTQNGLQLAEFSTMSMQFGKVWLTHVVDATNDYKVYIGWWTGNISEAALFYIDRSVSTTNWLCRTGTGSTYTTVDSGVAYGVTYATAQKLDIKMTASSARFYIDGTLVATISTNLPSQTTYARIGLDIVQSAGTYARGLASDWAYSRGLLSTPRNMVIP